MTSSVKPGRKPKLTAREQCEALERLAAGESQRSLARSYGVSQTTIWRLVSSDAIPSGPDTTARRPRAE